MNTDIRSMMSSLETRLDIDWATIISIAFVVLLMMLSLRLLGTGVRALARGVLQREKEPPRELAQKAKTLSQVAETTGRVVIFTIAILTILSMVAPNITPLLASAGIAGIAIGFGAQNLVKDWLGGFFILIENQYSVDDVIKVGTHSGTVEKLELRRTVLRALDGSAIVIPNGEVRIVTNMTKEWSRAVVDVGISYDEDVDRALEILNRVGRDLAEDPETGKMILELPEVLGVEELGEYMVTIRMMVKTVPAKQWAVNRAIRSRVRKAFIAEGIQVPYPRQVTISRNAPSWERAGGGEAETPQPPALE